LFFFRNPTRKIHQIIDIVLAPADGQIVSIELVDENEFLNAKCIRVSIFMSIFNVHVNRYPVCGLIVHTKYHQGKYFIASYPKSSEFNEHQSTVIKTTGGELLMIKQIAGTIARRVVCYAKEGMQVIQGGDLGFIKFGSRVDVFLPLQAKILVKINEKVKGNRTSIATLN
jgi:phosphatidylserine decarboxylase